MSAETMAPESRKPEELAPNRSEFLSFSDGDVVLISSDEVSFQVDSLVLRRASPFFADLFKLPQPTHQSRIPIHMEESSAVLDDILRSIYPPVIIPTLPSIDHAIALFNALQQFDISNKPLANAITRYIGNIEPPVRTWALACSLGHKEARKMAVKRFIQSDGDIYGECQLRMSELSCVSLQDFLKLDWVRKDAIKPGSLPSYGLLCNPFEDRHPCEGALSTGFTTATLDLPADTVLKAFLQGTGCRRCLDRFNSMSKKAEREQLRVSVESLLERAADTEIQNVELMQVHKLSQGLGRLCSIPYHFPRANIILSVKHVPSRSDAWRRAASLQGGLG